MLCYVCLEIEFLVLSKCTCCESHIEQFEGDKLILYTCLNDCTAPCYDLLYYEL